MSLHILDTDIASLFREGHPEVMQRVLMHPPNELAVKVDQTKAPVRVFSEIRHKFLRCAFISVRKEPNMPALYAQQFSCI